MRGWGSIGPLQRIPGILNKNTKYLAAYETHLHEGEKENSCDY